MFHRNQALDLTYFIGRAAAIAYAKEGADVAINYLPAEQQDAEEVQQVIELYIVDDRRRWLHCLTRQVRCKLFQLNRN
jgi:NAD(P)-dependent dehydrogenase (short-subunit alcohol dehydrogenase family)